jgi:hypothetical protein
MASRYTATGLLPSPQGTPDTPLGLGISTIPDYQQALDFAATLADGPAVPSSASGYSSSTFTAQQQQQHQQQQHAQQHSHPTRWYPLPKPRRTQLLPGTAPKSAAWKTKTAKRYDKKRAQAQGEATQQSIDSAVQSTFPPTAFGKKGQGARLGAEAHQAMMQYHQRQPHRHQAVIDPEDRIKVRMMHGGGTADGGDPQARGRRQQHGAHAAAAAMRNMHNDNTSQFPFDSVGSLVGPDGQARGSLLLAAGSGSGAKKKKKKKKEERYQDQIGIKLSWSAWMNKREDEKFHQQTIAKATSHVGKDINEHRTRLRKLKQIFDPTKIAMLTRKFEQDEIARDNRDLVKRLEKVANANTVITKTNDPNMRRYVNKVRKDKMRMLRQSKQHKLNELNFENKLLLDLLSRSHSSIPSKKECARHFSRHKEMRNCMAKVFTPKTVLMEKRLKKKKRLAKKKERARKWEEKMRRGGGGGGGGGGGRGRGGRGGQSMPPRLYEVDEPLPPIMQRAMMAEQFKQQLHSRQYSQQRSQQHSQQHLQEQQQPQRQQVRQGTLDGGLNFTSDMAGHLPDEGWRAVMPNPKTQNDRSGVAGAARERSASTASSGGYGGGRSTAGFSRGNLGTGGSSVYGGLGYPPPSTGEGSLPSRGGLPPSTRGSVGSGGSGMSSAGGTGLGPIEGAFEKRRMLMEPRQMAIGGTHMVSVSAFRGVHDRLVYELSDPLSGIVRYFDIPAQLILDVGKEYPELLSTRQTKRVQKLCALLDVSRDYFSDPDNVVAKMFWWQGKEQQQHGESSGGVADGR